MKILIIQQKMIGDVLTTSVLFEALKQELPDAELHYLVQKNTTAVIENNRYIDQIIVSNEERNKSLVKLLKKEEYNVIIDAYSTITSGILTLRVGAKQRIGLSKWFSKLTYSHQLSLRSKSKKGIALALENRFQLLEPLLNQVDYQLKPKIFLRKQELEVIKKKLDSFDFESNKPSYMMNVLGSSNKKTYPPKAMAKLIDYIIDQQPDAQVLFNYIPKQIEGASEIFDLCAYKTQKRIRLDLYGNSLRDFIVLTACCTALIGNEGGAVNIAKALNIPNFALFSPWVTTKAWAINETNPKHVAIHLKQFFPEKFKDYNKKKFKKEQTSFYSLLTPELVKPKLNLFLKSLN